MTSDLELLDAWLAGRADAGQALMARHYEAVRRFFETKLPEVAEDLTQQTLLACVQGGDRFRREGTFRAYLFGIARRQFYLHVRQHQRRAVLETFAAAQGPATAATPTGMIATRQEQRLILRAFQELVPEQQISVQLFYWEEMSLAEIGTVLGVSVTAVTSRLDRARQAMRRFVERLELQPATRASVLADLEGWTRSVVQRSK
jgi:RNA polymerase sigma-70 factor, ECF subfamily